MDGSTAGDGSNDFVLFHPGATAVLVNPSPRLATVTITAFDSTSRAITLAPFSKVSIPINAISRVQSSEPLASVERFGVAPKFGLGTPAVTGSGQTSFVIPGGVVGGGYITTLSLANLSAGAADVTVSFVGNSKQVHINANSATSLSLADFLQIPVTPVRSDAVRVDSTQPVIAVVDIENTIAVVSLESRPAVTDAWFPNVAEGNGLSTMLSIATGATAANVTVEVYPSTGGTPQSATITVKGNQQVSKAVRELVSSVTEQQGGYIRLHSDQPIWSWGTYVSSTILASVPPLP
jgi:hypothetical protein